MVEDQGPDTRFPPASHAPGEEANWVIGVLDNEDAARRARDAALQVGFAPDDVILLSGQEARDRAQARQEQMNPVTKFFANLARQATDPGMAESEYLAEADAGHWLLCVKANDPGQVALSQRVMLESNARRVKYFGGWTITDLSQPPADLRGAR